mgnify:CR=1 FL=1
MLTKPKPSAQHLTNNAWRHENPTEKGKRGNLYFPFNTHVKDKNKKLLHDIGAGINMENQTAQRAMFIANQTGNVEMGVIKSLQVSLLLEKLQDRKSVV